MRKKFLIGAAALLSALLLVACPDDTTYTVKYLANGATTGHVPTDGRGYRSGDIVTVLAKPAALVRTGFIFAGWQLMLAGINDSEGVVYKPGQQFRIYENSTFKASWVDGTPTSDTITVASGVDTVQITVNDGKLATGLKAYVNANGTAVIITTTSVKDFTPLDADRVIQPLAPDEEQLSQRPATPEGTIKVVFPSGAGAGSATQLQSGSVTVTLAPEAQDTPVGSITVTSSPSPVWDLAAALDRSKCIIDNVAGTVTLTASPSAAGPVTIPADITLIVPLSVASINTSLVVQGTLSIEEAAGHSILTITDSSTIEIAAGGKLETKLTGEKRIQFGSSKTQLSCEGSWSASGGSITITSSAGVASFTATSGTATLTAGGTSPTITQGSGAGNALEIGAGVTIDLGATNSGGKVGEIVLKSDATAPGKLAFDGVGARILTGATGGSQMNGEAGDFVLVGNTTAGKMRVTGFYGNDFVTIVGGNKMLQSITYGGGTASITGPASGADGSISAVTDCQ